MPGKQKVITVTVKRLSGLADHLESQFPADSDSSEIISDAVLVIRELATNLDAYDARESRLEPKRRKAARKAKKAAKTKKAKR